MTRFRINKDVEIEIIRKGEKASKPLGFINWISYEATENGINVIWGHRGEVGTYIPEKVLRRILKEFEKNDKINDDNP